MLMVVYWHVELMTSSPSTKAVDKIAIRHLLFVVVVFLFVICAAATAAAHAVVEAT